MKTCINASTRITRTIRLRVSRATDTTDNVLDSPLEHTQRMFRVGPGLRDCIYVIEVPHKADVFVYISRRKISA